MVLSESPVGANSTNCPGTGCEPVVEPRNIVKLPLVCCLRSPVACVVGKSNPRYQRMAPAESNAMAKSEVPPSASAASVYPRAPVPVVVNVTCCSGSGSSPPTKLTLSDRTRPLAPNASTTPRYDAPLRRPSTGIVAWPVARLAPGVESTAAPGAANRSRAESACSAATATLAARALVGFALADTDVMCTESGGGGVVISLPLSEQAATAVSSAAATARQGVGWFTRSLPKSKRRRQKEAGDHPPLGIMRSTRPIGCVGAHRRRIHGGPT